jgi:peptide/nickel transport system substrate-binding protein
MKKIILCLLIWSTITLLITSCGSPSTQTISTSTATTATSSVPATTSAGTPAKTTSATPSSAAPRYGGVFSYWLKTDPMSFDEAFAVHPNITTAALTQDKLLIGDWAKGPAGTGETDWTYGFIGRISLMTGSLAQGWETPDDVTIIYRLRQGVHFALNPSSEASRLVNGRELVADDVVFSINRAFSSKTAYLYSAYTSVGNQPTSVKAIDKYTVEVKTPATMHGLMVAVCGGFLWTWPQEVINKYGDMRDWKNSVGSGPFMLTDYVAGSSATFKRNPQYFGKDPLHPQNQLPYLDGVKELIIPDISTYLAALRTGKLDMLPAVSWEDGTSLIKTNPQLKYHTRYQTPTFPVGRVDKADLPFKDIKVRQALNLAIDKQAILKDYLGGHGALLGYPWPPTKTYDQIYTPLEQQSKAVQDLFTYNPTKAKQLLSEAGYPNGFVTHVICDGTSTQPDLLSILREQFLKVGVDMQIQPKEAGVFTTITRGRLHEEMVMKNSVDYSFPFRMLMVRKESFDDPAYFEADFTRQAYNEVSRLVGIDDAAVNRNLKEVGKFSLEQAWGIWLPAPEVWDMWQPWVGGYHGEQDVGYLAGPANRNMDWVWIDQDLKASLR